MDSPFFLVLEGTDGLQSIAMRTHRQIMIIVYLSHIHTHRYLLLLLYNTHKGFSGIDGGVVFCSCGLAKVPDDRESREVCLLGHICLVVDSLYRQVYCLFRVIFSGERYPSITLTLKTFPFCFTAGLYGSQTL